MAVHRKFVPDASVILKWVLPKDTEPHFEEAAAILESFHSGLIDLLTPTVWIYEAGNLLGRRYPDRANDLLSILESFNMEVILPNPNWRQQTLLLMKQYSVTFYDAAYHALAITENAVLVTADTAYVRKVNHPAEVIPLSAWTQPFPTVQSTPKE